MSIKKLTAGSGYDYLTRHVAAMDSTEKGHLTLASYYSAKGDVPGVWVGRGMTGLDGLAAGDPVTAEQMKALFGAGYHPLAKERLAALGPDATAKDFVAATNLGRAFAVRSPDVTPFRREVAKRFAAYNASVGAGAQVAVPREERGRIRTQVAREFFMAEFRREPQDARELASLVARLSRPANTSVAGFDLTFSPVKSVSALWALADQTTSAAIERAHQKAVTDALTFIEDHALFTRLGVRGVRQVNVTGLIGTAFTHRDSRAGDPDLHTHVAVANKVQTLDGLWRAIDGRIIYKAVVAASETYNTALERHLATDLGLVFKPRKTPDGKRPIREVVGVSPRLIERWSSRRRGIQVRASELAEAFQKVHGRTPTAVEMIGLADQAWEETRQAKHSPRALAEQRATWRREAEAEVVRDGWQSVDAMVRSALHPTAKQPDMPDHAWYRDAAREIIEMVEADRAVWQYWHVHSEAKRMLRPTALRPDQLERAADWLTRTALKEHAVMISRPDGIEEPAELRRADGTSVHHVAKSQLYTSSRIVTAEQRIVAAAGCGGGRRIPVQAVEVALLESVANGLTLNAGQAAMVRAMATSGARVQLGIAPAGSGKTTAMATLARAWRETGGKVLGLSPAAAAAAQLRSQIDTHTDTLAKLVWSIENKALPKWATAIGPKTLVIIDEAGTADTLSLDTAIDFIVKHGGSVRLIGDDQQLGSIAAGGVLRDIAAQHGAVHLNELLRFDDPAEGNASLALREGRPEALGFYLDNGRVHIGEPDGLSRAVFDSWKTDRAEGCDAIMLAPTRDLVAQLNQKARAHRLGDKRPGREVSLADGNLASAGDTIITRANDRRLRVSRTDWVKNGDRWTVLKVAANGRLKAKHNTHRRTITLPAKYVAKSVELGYASTIHGAQGVTADAMHGLATGSESRQQLYTMLTRGRTANHLYLAVVGDGDPHSLVDPDTVIPPTPTDLLSRILTRDEAPVSATTAITQQDDPAVRLGHAADSYADALLVATEHTADPEAIARIDGIADTGLGWITFEPAWPTLRSHLLLLHATGVDPLLALNEALARRSLHDALDAAAVLDWRLDATRKAPTGPLPWLPGVPKRLADDPTWGTYLTARAELVRTLADDVHASALTTDNTPAWVGDQPPSAELCAEVAVWRAAMSVPDSDLRPTGEPQFAAAAARYQHRLNRQLGTTREPALAEWTPLFTIISPAITNDPYAATLARNLARLSRANLDATGLLASAAAEGTLPDDHAAAALWWRINRHLEPAVAKATTDTTPTPWTEELEQVISPERAEQLRASTWWPALVTALDHATARGWTLTDLLNPISADAVDECQALVWRTTMLTNPIHDDPIDTVWTPEPEQPTVAGAQAAADELEVVDDAWPILQIEAEIRSLEGEPELTQAEVQQQLTWRDALREAGVTADHLAHINEITTQYYESRFPHSWARDYLASRLHTDLAGDPDYRPGYAPGTWTSLVNHLRREGVTDQDMILAGVAKLASNGNLIDRFRNRLVFPITHDGQVLGFIARRHPDTDDTAGPKYLNTPETPVFHKGEHLYGHAPSLLRGGRPVLVEGPMDAIAVTLATNGGYVGVAALGTALTREQARELRRYTDLPIVATDNDPAGRAAAERAYWTLTGVGLDPLQATLPEGSDPADLVAQGRPQALATALTSATPLTRAMLKSALSDPTSPSAAEAAIRVIAAADPSHWQSAITETAQATGRPDHDVRQALAITLGEEPPTAATQSAPRRRPQSSPSSAAPASLETQPSSSAHQTPRR